MESKGNEGISPERTIFFLHKIRLQVSLLLQLHEMKKIEKQDGSSRPVAIHLEEKEEIIDSKDDIAREREKSKVMSQRDLILGGSLLLVLLRFLFETHVSCLSTDTDTDRHQQEGTEFGEKRRELDEDDEMTSKDVITKKRGERFSFL